VIFGLPLVISGVDGLFVVVGFAALSFGETMMAPILSPLAAALAPVGAVGRTMAAVTGATTVATAIGPILSSALLGMAPARRLHRLADPVLPGGSRGGHATEDHGGNQSATEPPPSGCRTHRITAQTSRNTLMYAEIREYRGVLG
jgi:hypothetical protein